MTDSLSGACGLAVIVAHQEDTSALAAALVGEGFQVAEVRGPYTPQQQRFSSSMKCMINHANAWRIAASRPGHTLIVEADFVPVAGVGALPGPTSHRAVAEGVSYLYSVGPQIWDVVNRDWARGHSGGLVAYALSASVARLLSTFCDEELEQNPQGKYSVFDTRLGFWLLKRGVQSYLPYRHYGEHGGIGNPEHATGGSGRAHRADALHGPLLFLPAYAQGSKAKLAQVRLRARLWGFLRLISGRLLALRDLRRNHPALAFAAGRLIRQRPCVDGSSAR